LTFQIWNLVFGVVIEKPIRADRFKLRGRSQPISVEYFECITFLCYMGRATEIFTTG